MAFPDWNGNGKSDIGDSFMEYNIFNSSTDNKGGGGGYKRPSDGKKSFWFFVIICILISLLTECNH